MSVRYNYHNVGSSWSAGRAPVTAAWVVVAARLLIRCDQTVRALERSWQRPLTCCGRRRGDATCRLHVRSSPSPKARHGPARVTAHVGIAVATIKRIDSQYSTHPPAKYIYMCVSNRASPPSLACVYGRV